MKHITPISKASADKQALSIITTIVSILTSVIPMILQIVDFSNNKEADSGTES